MENYFCVADIINAKIIFHDFIKYFFKFIRTRLKYYFGFIFMDSAFIYDRTKVWIFIRNIQNIISNLYSEIIFLFMIGLRL